METDIKNVDEYIHALPAEIQETAQKIRAMIKEEAADCTESISYGIPAYKTFGKPLVYFAVYKNHIGLYATPSGHAEFSNELSKYKQGKGSVQFPLDSAIPFDLIQKIVTFKVKENSDKFKK